MDMPIQKLKRPDYKKIYTDILNKKYPHKIKISKTILLKEELNFLDIIQLNKMIFGHDEKVSGNQRHRSYDIQTILEILEHQKKYKLNNSQLATHFKLSRNTIAKWKRNFSDLIHTK